MKPLSTLAERRARGKSLRERVPRGSHAGWIPAPDRRDPIAILIESGRHRIPELLPIRTARMLESPFAFLRGAAAVMAADLATTPTTGLRVQACGDCHLMNFGVYASPEGTPIFDINDFDETLPAPFEWDVKRLSASIVLSGRHDGLGPRATAKAVRACVQAYRLGLADLAREDPYLLWHRRIDVMAALHEVEDLALRESEIKRLGEKDGVNPAFYAFPKLVGREAGEWRIKDNPPLIHHFRGKDPIPSLLKRYCRNLPEERGVLLDRYRLMDSAFKVVGVGSVGTFCAVSLVMTGDGHPLFLQIKEAQPSVLAPYAGASRYSHQGQRVVTGQRLIQPVSDIFLGWTEDKTGGRAYYVRELKDRKLAAVGAAMVRGSLLFYAALCGRTLALSHARSGDAATIAGYLGSSAAFDEAIADFAAAYADQTERDHQLLTQAVAAGRITASPGT